VGDWLWRHSMYEMWRITGLLTFYMLCAWGAPGHNRRVALPIKQGDQLGHGYQQCEVGKHTTLHLAVPLGPARSLSSPLPFPPHTDCTWNFTAPKGYAIQLQLSFARRDLDSNELSSLYLFDGVCVLSSPMLSDFPGDANFNSSSRSLSVKAINSPSPVNARGFRLSYQAVPRPHPATPSQPLSTLQQQQRTALQTLFEETNGKNWSHFFGWLPSCPACPRHGVDCDEAGLVSHINLSSNNLKGRVPGLGALAPSLQVLQVSDNSLMGSIPPDICQMHKMSVLFFDDNYFTGPMPLCMGDLASLKWFKAGYNALTGPLPPSLGKCNRLTAIILQGNQLTGPVPPGIAELPQVVEISLGRNRFTQGIPRSFGKLRTLKILNFGINYLNGTIPAQLGELKNLTFLGLGNNSLSGTIPPQLGKLTGMKTLHLDRNCLTGPIPPGLSALTRARALHLGYNSLTGTIPAELTSLTSLYFFFLGSNNLQGTVPELRWNSLTVFQVAANKLTGTIPQWLGASTTALRSINVSHNSLNGSIPEGLANARGLSIIALEDNQLSGPIPLSIYTLQTLRFLHLSYNRLTGTISAAVANLTFAVLLSYYSNRLTGTLPEELATLSRLIVFDAGVNQLHGKVPDLRRLTRLKQMSMPANRLSGPLPITDTMPELILLELHTNEFEGTVPSLKHNSKIQFVLLNNNPRLVGALDHSLPSSIMMLLLHGNSMTGFLPSFSAARSLKWLSLFGNSFRGAVSLPSRTKLHLLYVQSNRLSCPISAPDTSVTVHGNGKGQARSLALPGNNFNGPLPHKLRLATAKASFLLANDFWESWYHEIIMLSFGLPLLFVSVALIPQFMPLGTQQDAQQPNTPPLGLRERLWLSRDALVIFLKGIPEEWGQRHDDARQLFLLQAQCKKVLAVWSIVGLATLFPMWYTGSNFFECGEVWLHGTLSYLSDAPTSEWAGAVAACLFAGAGTALIYTLKEGTRKGRALAPLRAQSCWKKNVLLAVLWGPVVVLLSLPMVFYVLSLSIPADNTLNLDYSILTFVRATIGVILYAIKSLLLPELAAFVASLVYKEAPPKVLGLMMVSAVAFIVVISPALVLVIVHQNCFALWMWSWTPCSYLGNFDNFLDAAVTEFPYEIPCMWLPSSKCYIKHNEYLETRMASIHVHVNITTHQQICSPGYIGTRMNRDGRCPRSLTADLGTLYTKELLASASISPLILLLRATRQWAAMKGWVVETVLRKRHDYESPIAVDRLIFGVALNLQLPLMLGFQNPQLPVLAGLVVALNAGVFHIMVIHMRVALSMKASVDVSKKLLLSSLALGMAFVIWQYAEADLHGKWFAAVGVPLSMAVVGMINHRLAVKDTEPMRQLREPLMSATPQQQQQRNPAIELHAM